MYNEISNNGRGRLCHDLTFFFASKWQTTEKGLNWIHLIQDPTHALEEWQEYLIAHYVAVAEIAGSKDPQEIHMHSFQESKLGSKIKIWITINK